MNTDFYIGLALAVSSSIFIGTSFILKKKGLLKLSLRAGDGGYGYLKEHLWWSGMISMTVGEIANFAAYAFSPATLVTPLGALSVLVTAILSSKFLKENLNLLGKLGCLVCILGSTVLVIHSPKEQDLHSMKEVSLKLCNSAFIVYALSVVGLACGLIFYASPRYGRSNPLVYITITGTIGSLTVMGCKGLGIALKQTVTESNQMTNPLTWFLLAACGACITIQLNYMNKALDVFNTSVVTPLLYVVFTGFVILASVILFDEWRGINALDAVGILCGLLTIIAGVFLLQGFKDLDISVGDLPRSQKDCAEHQEFQFSSESLNNTVEYSMLPSRDANMF